MGKKILKIISIIAIFLVTITSTMFLTRSYAQTCTVGTACQIAKQLETRITTATSNYNTNETAIAEYKTQIEDIETKRENIENAIASFGIDTTNLKFDQYADAIKDNLIGKKQFPTKGDLITIADAPEGAQTYRVIKTNVNGDSNIVEVLGMDEINTSVMFNSSGINTYAGGELDTFLNTTWYNTLSDTMKNAIVSKTFNQDIWDWDISGNHDYNGMYDESVPPTFTYSVSLVSATYKDTITRNVYALSVQDIIDYLEVNSDVDASKSTLQNYNIWDMYYNIKTQPSPRYFHWLRSANSFVVQDRDAFFIDGEGGALYFNDANETPINRARASFQIDLSKVSWEFTE